MMLHNIAHIHRLKHLLKMKFDGRLFKILFDFGFCLFFSPFRFTIGAQKEASCRHQIRRIRLQQIICGIGELLGTVVCLGEAIENLVEVKKKTAVAYFNAFFGITNIINSIIGTWWVWKKQKLVRNIANEIDKTSDISNKLRTLMTFVTTFLCLMATIMSIASAVLGATIFSVWRWTPEYLWKRWILTARSHLLGYDMLSPGNEPEMSNISLGHQILGGVYAVGTLFKWIQKLFLELTLLVGILSFWMMSYSFAKCIERSQAIGIDLEWEVIAKKYKCLKKFSKLFNRTFGALIFIYVWNSLLVCATRLDTFFTQKDEFFRWRGLLYMYVAVGLIFIVSADCSRQAQNISGWLSSGRNSQKIESDNALSYLVNDISRNTIAVSGLRIFSITYGFVANVTVIVVTYFIICVQTRGETPAENQ